MKRSKTLITFGVVLFCSITPVLAQENGTAPSDPDAPTGNIPANTPENTENLGTTLADPNVVDPLPEIEAKTFPVKILKRSKSKNVYLVEDVNNAKTKVGKILLFKQEIEPFIAGRVIRTYPERNQIAVKKLKHYENHKELSPGESFVVIEKVADLLPDTIDKTAPPLSEQDEADLNELEPNKKSKKKKKEPIETAESAPSDLESGSTEEYDPELDAGTSPKPVDEENPDDGEPEEEQNSLVIEEVNPIETNRHWVTAQFGFFRDLAYNPEDGTMTNAAGGIRYGYSIARMVFIKKPLLQDSIAIEGSVFLYKLFAYANNQDVYTVMPLLLTTRYNLFIGHNLGVFLYAGVRKNYVVDSANTQIDAVDLLSQTTFAGGAGVMLGIVPNWDIRLDAGLDMFGAGMVIRF